jgi:hypothetical protein
MITLMTIGMSFGQIIQVFVGSSETIESLRTRGYDIQGFQQVSGTSRGLQTTSSAANSQGRELKTPTFSCNRVI